MQAFRSVLWRRLPANLQRRSPLLVRCQQNWGPHKEYFQTPGQAPVPDITPYDPKEPIQTHVTRRARSRTSRLSRSVLWTSLFAVLGAAGGTALITWEYLQPPFEPGSEEEKELQSEIDELLESHPLVEDLRQRGWIEDNFYEQRQRYSGQAGQNLIHDTLTGTQGITIRAFRHPAQAITCFVFFPGFGVEGWPDVMHGGAITALALEGMTCHHKNFFSSRYADMDAPEIHVHFRQPARPGEVYALIVTPSFLMDVPDDPDARMLGSIWMMLHDLDRAPEVECSFDPAERDKSLPLDIEKEVINLLIPSGTGDMGVPTTANGISMLRVTPKDTEAASVATSPHENPWS
jgi:hypothetical protein